MADKNTQIVLGPSVAARLNKMLTEWEHYVRYSTASKVPSIPNFLPIPKVGKATANIAARSFGPVEIWQGKPGQETKIDKLSAVQEFNLLDRTITSGKFCWMFGQYIFGATFPARFIDCTLNSSLASGSNVTAAVVGHLDGDDPGASTTVYMPPLSGLPTIASGSTIRALWNDVRQRYEALQWGCAT